MRVLLIALLLAVLTACGQGSPSPSSDSTGEPQNEGEGEVCVQVRAGIDAFNQGDLDETVARFEFALPLAESAAEDEPSRRAALLLEAVEYYAELPAEDYAAAANGSPEFEKYKQITLSQCAGEGQIGPPEEPDVEV